MAASETSICNRAIQLLGAKRITSLSEDSRNARALNDAYEHVRDAELRRHPWSFAIKRASLAADSPAPSFGPTNSFTLPSDYLRLLPPDPEFHYNDLDWKIEGGSIYTYDSAPLRIRYVRQETNPVVMDPLFRESLAAALAVATCEAITQSNTKKADLEEDYSRIIAEARRTNAIETVSDEPPEDTWVTARL